MLWEPTYCKAIYPRWQRREGVGQGRLMEGDDTSRTQLINEELDEVFGGDAV